MRKMNRFIPVALACAIFAAQPVQAATIIRDSRAWKSSSFPVRQAQ